MKWQVSRYTHLLPVPEGGVIYNGRTGAVAELSAEGFRHAGALLDQIRRGNIRRMTSTRRELFEQLQVGEFIVSSELDELALIEEQYMRERARSQFLFTILPTFACNLACDYCFVGKKKGVMSREVQDNLVEFARQRILAQRPPSMHVDWFGGEPLLALPVIETLSEAFLALCQAYGLQYRAQVITNGTMIDQKAADVLTRAHVNRLQISLDGLPDIHDARRPYKSARGSSFGTILDSLPAVIGRFLVRLRINVDARNVDQVWPLLDLFAERGWLGPDTRFFPYLARVSPFTDACAGSAAMVCRLDDFHKVQFRWMEQLEHFGVPIIEQGLYQFPEPKLYSCGAVGSNGFVFTPDGEIHKCGLEVDDSSRAIGHLGAQWNDGTNRFAEYTPFTNPICRECNFLPTCLGGCPRNQLNRREVQLKENCEYYQQFEQQILLFHLGHRSELRLAPEARLQTSSAVLFPILS
jgi:uncharacterized protein